MAGGTLLVSRAEKLLPTWKARLEEFGFSDVSCTSKDKDGLRLDIMLREPATLVVCCAFYKNATPYMMGKLASEFGKLNIVAVNLHEYPDRLAALFMANGVNSYVNMQDGMEEFYRGLRTVRDGGTYISEGVRRAMERRHELPKPGFELTGRQMEVARLICSGFLETETADTLQISVKTVRTHKRDIYRAANVRNSAELVLFALSEGIVTLECLNFCPIDFGANGKRHGRENDFKNEKRRAG